MADTLPAALANVQAKLPQIVKSETADTGKYTYTYASLADISEQVLPLLSDHGLSFVCMPTLTDTGHFVLHYQLLHTSGDLLEGRYPLPSGGTPQSQGSAITYARRYVLTALVGVAPEDDDGQEAQQAATAKPASVDLAAFDVLVGSAKKAGIVKTEAEWKKLRDWAGQSDANRDKACDKVSRAMDEVA